LCKKVSPSNYEQQQLQGEGHVVAVATKKVIFSGPERKNSFRNALLQLHLLQENSPFLKMAPSLGQTPPWAATAINRSILPH
jgi:hypothetical protein